MTKLLPGHETLLLIPAIETLGVPYGVGTTGTVIYSALTTAILNEYQSITGNASSGAGPGGNVSFSTLDSLKLGLSASSTDKGRTITTTGQAEPMTFMNFDAELEFLVDLVPTSTTSNYAMSNDLVRAPDIPYLVVHRVGKLSTQVFAVGDEIDVYYIWTDNSVLTTPDGSDISNSQKSIPKNIVSTPQVVAA